MKSPLATFISLLVGLLGSALVIWGIHTYFAPSPHVPPIKTEETFYQEGTYSEEDKIYDTHMYYALRSNAHYRVKKTRGDEVVYDVEYTTDDKRRRINPYNREDKKDQEIVFFGCSFTVGEGVEDKENLPAQLGSITQNVYTYNYGAPGYGPGHLLSFMENYPLEKDVENKEKAKFIYVFPDFHIRRSLGTLFVLATFAHAYPYYELLADGTLKRNGNLQSSRPWETKLAQFIYYFNFIKNRNVDFPAYCDYSDKDNYLVFKIIEKAAQIYKQKMNDHFYVLLFPSFDYTLKKMGPWFAQSGIKVLDYTSLIPSWYKERDRWLIKYDEHPTAETYKMMAQRLKADFQL